MCLGIPGRIVEIVDVERQRVMADVEGVRREISVALLGIANEDGSVAAAGDATGQSSVATGVGVGDWVLIHVAFAMAQIDEQEAEETLRALKLFSGAFEEEMFEFGADGEIDPLDVLRPSWAAAPTDPS